MRSCILHSCARPLFFRFRVCMRVCVCLAGLISLSLCASILSLPAYRQAQLRHLRSCVIEGAPTNSGRSGRADPRAWSEKRRSSEAAIRREDRNFDIEPRHCLSLVASLSLCAGGCVLCGFARVFVFVSVSRAHSRCSPACSSSFFRHLSSLLPLSLSLFLACSLLSPALPRSRREGKVARARQVDCNGV